MPDIGTVALPNSLADSEAGGSGAAEAGWAGPVRHWESVQCAGAPMTSMKTSVLTLHEITTFFAIFFTMFSEIN